VDRNNPHRSAAGSLRSAFSRSVHVNIVAAGDL
jgi:nucleoside diphosphate kinase